ncbi:glycosyltransferase family 2 protein [Pseudoalteromonas sp. CO342X]|uniref:glycosyltransferase family 2 protein n=1 Tax=Pseudoalteromonas sp. CO342X TaxID=1777270 RepID=UPI001023E228|nr:glycosyltransferase family 2 protein [Pseudoalteromonas sp. CO342X]RZG14184.1 glycosyltransferase family 2 protein [Pseudoalteromonas sp. CO342X]
MISIVVPYYNKSLFIEKTLKSIINNFAGDELKSEIIVVNDGSENSESSYLRNLIASIDDNSIKLIELDENRGVSIARNTGIEAALGDYIYFLDADDFFQCDSKKLLNDILISKFTCFFNLKINKKLFKHHLLDVQKVDEYVLVNLFKQRTIHLSNVVFHRSDLEGVYFEEGVAYGEDLFFIFKAILNKEVRFFDSSIAIYNYDGKFHPIRNSAYHLMLNEFESFEILYKSIYQAYNERVFLHNKFYNQNLHFDEKVVSNKLKIFNFFRFRVFYKLLQSIRTRF